MSGRVLWFTGLSGAGKSTIAMLAERKLSSDGYRVRTFDGDTVRANFHGHLGFSPADIRENNRLIAELCAEALPDCDVILVPVISPFRDARRRARERLGAAFVEVYAKAGLAAVSARDPKGLYKAVRDGRSDPLIGMADGVPYEPPELPEVLLDTESSDAESCADQLVSYVKSLSHPARTTAASRIS